MLRALLERAGVPDPQLVIMLDHKQENLNEVMQEFSWSDIKTHAWRYTRDRGSADTAGL